MTIRRETARAVRVSLRARDADLGVPPLVADPATVEARIRQVAENRAILERAGTDPGRPDVVRVLVGDRAVETDGAVEREIVVDGWSIVVRIESDRRVALRERATKARAAARPPPTTEVRAVIPGRVVEVGVAVGDSIDAGSRLLLVEAMKMQNEVRTPRAGRVARVEVAAGQTVELGDLLVVIE